ncbi:MAG: hypothetical protein HQL97_06880 [Magnetococcales bacterium]|nr:hypothetical protein [Magnetococcales bacterium]
MNSLLNENNDLRILYVHGMGHHNKNFADELVAKVSSSMPDIQNFNPHRDFVDIPLVSDKRPVYDEKYQNKPLPDGNLRLWKIQKGENQIIFGALQWSNIMLPAKERAFYDDGLLYLPVREGGDPTLLKSIMRNDTKIGANRALFNAALRKGFNDGFADAVLYLGKHGSSIRSVIEDGLCHLMQEKERIGSRPHSFCKFPTPNDRQRFNLALITSSLGSKMTYDTILDLLEEERGQPFQEIWKQQLLNKIKLFMFSNQLPLLELAEHAYLETVTPDQAKNQKNLTKKEELDNKRLNKKVKSNEKSLSNKESPEDKRLSNKESPKSRTFNRFLGAIAGVQLNTVLDGDSSSKNKIKEVEIVDFVDPNDILSWTIPITNDFSRELILANNTPESKYITSNTNRGDKIQKTFTNVLVKNESLYFLSTTVFVHPGLSHTCASRNPYTLNLIFYGNDYNKHPLIETSCITKE